MAPRPGGTADYLRAMTSAGFGVANHSRTSASRSARAQNLTASTSSFALPQQHQEGR